MEIAVLIARIILLILQGIFATGAVSQIAGESGLDFSELWSHLPSNYK
ncbi:hypothetical protein [Tepidibacter mesophilus]|nr:hypothetical protein [Tepidibacter mesophilus]